jgi:hypothetical protein
MDRTVEAVERISGAEARFERWRWAAGFVVAPLAFAALLMFTLLQHLAATTRRGAVTVQVGTDEVRCGFGHKVKFAGHKMKIIRA